MHEQKNSLSSKSIYLINCLIHFHSAWQKTLILQGQDYSELLHQLHLRRQKLVEIMLGWQEPTVVGEIVNARKNNCDKYITAQEKVCNRWLILKIKLMILLMLCVSFTYKLKLFATAKIVNRAIWKAWSISFWKAYYNLRITDKRSTTMF